MKVSCSRSLLTMTVIAVTAPAFAQVQSSAMVAVSQTTASTRIDQPATLTSSQDLTFALQTSVAASLTLPPTLTNAAASVAASTPGTVARAAPANGSAGVTLSRATLTSVTTPVPAAARATFTVSGDSGQAISVTVPQSVDLARNGGVETALLTTTNNLADGPQFLGGTFAGGGTLSFAVGGQVTLASASSVSAGTYNGLMAVIAQYN